jgi:hypothetical protein
MTYSQKILSSFLYLSLASIAGCNGGTPTPDPGESVLVDGTTSFALASSGGGLAWPAVPQGAACDPQIWTYTVHIGASLFAWDRCDVNGPGTEPANYIRVSGTRTLSRAELDTATAAARLVKVSDRNTCGADKPSLHLGITAATGSITYGDDFYACLKQDDAYVEGASLDNLGTVLRALDQQVTTAGTR